VPLAGQTIKAAEFGTVYTDYQSDTRTTSSGSYGAGTGGTACGVAFTAPPSGKVLIHFKGRLSNNSASGWSFMAPAVRTGTTVGSGTSVLAASDENAVSFEQHATVGERMDIGATCLVTGLTAGASYNAMLEYKANGATGTSSFTSRKIIVQPVH
jgi:hypothetical protein